MTWLLLNMRIRKATCRRWFSLGPSLVLRCKLSLTFYTLPFTIVWHIAVHSSSVIELEDSGLLASCALCGLSVSSFSWQMVGEYGRFSWDDLLLVWGLGRRLLLRLYISLRSRLSPCVVFVLALFLALSTSVLCWLISRPGVLISISLTRTSINGHASTSS